MGHDVRKELVALLPRMRRFAYSLTGSMEEAEEVLQSACEKALSRLDQFEPGTRLDSWMFQIIRSVRIDRVRYSIRRPVSSDPDIAQTASFDARTHEQLEARMDLDIIRSEIANLPEEQRAVLALVTVDGMSYQDAADTLGVPIGTIMSRLARARRKLAEAIDMPRSGQRGRPSARERTS
jgi:RNA polymerase sigma-70 factor (ECF subfamily)